MAGGARAGSSASAFHLKVVGLRNIEEVVAIGYFENVGVAFLIYKGNSASTIISINIQEAFKGITYSSPGFGGVKSPCRDTDVEEKPLKLGAEIGLASGAWERD
jgi:hypothetical protein